MAKPSALKKFFIRLILAMLILIPSSAYTGYYLWKQNVIKRQAQEVIAEKSKEVHIQRHLKVLFDNVPAHVVKMGMQPKALLGIQQSESGGELRLLIEDPKDETIYIATYEFNGISLWVSEFSVVRPPGLFTKFSSHIGN